MIDEAIRTEMELIMRQINTEEGVERGCDRGYIRELWQKYHSLSKLLKDNDKEG